MSLISFYFVFGIAFYTGLALKSAKSFVSADIASLLRGLLLGLIFWPMGLVIQTVLALEDLKGHNN